MAYHAAQVIHKPLTDETLLACYLCLEQKDAKNLWFTLYRSTLPPKNERLLLPLCLMEDEKEGEEEEGGMCKRCLPNCYWDALQFARRYVKRQHECCVEAMVPIVGTKEELIPSAEEFSRAFALVRSRSFALNDQLFQGEEGEDSGRHKELITQQDNGTRRVLLPFYDLFNHRQGAKARIEKRLNLKTNVRTWHILSQEKLNAGDEIYNSYGNNRGNLDLFLTYGFIDVGNGGRRIAFNRRELIRALLEARPLVFGVDSNILQSITKRLRLEEETLRGEPMQNLALYSLDLVGERVVSGDGLKAALETFKGMSIPLGSNEEEAESFVSDVLDAMLKGRLVELDHCLDCLNQGEKDSEVEVEVWWREQIGALLKAERDAIGNFVLMH